MSDLARRARVRVLLADYASIDAAGKINIIGGGVSLINYEPMSGTTLPFSVVVLVDFTLADVDETPAIEVLLEDSTGAVVTMPGPTGPLGQQQTMAIAQTPRVEQPVFPGLSVPRRAIRPRWQFVGSFANGLPLTLGQSYKWRVKIDGFTSDDWTIELFVPGPPPGPVMGGASGPSDIPNVGNPTSDH